MRKRAAYNSAGLPSWEDDPISHFSVWPCIASVKQLYLDFTSCLPDCTTCTHRNVHIGRRVAVTRADMYYRWRWSVCYHPARQLYVAAAAKLFIRIFVVEQSLGSRVASWLFGLSRTQFRSRRTEGKFQGLSWVRRKQLGCAYSNATCPAMYKLFPLAGSSMYICFYEHTRRNMTISYTTVHFWKPMKDFANRQRSQL